MGNGNPIIGKPIMAGKPGMGAIIMGGCSGRVGGWQAKVLALKGQARCHGSLLPRRSSSPPWQGMFGAVPRAQSTFAENHNCAQQPICCCVWCTSECGLREAGRLCSREREVALPAELEQVVVAAGSCALKPSPRVPTYHS